MKPTILSMVLLLTIAGAASAATIHVPADQPTIQAGIDAAVDGDSVLLASGIYTGNGNRDVVVVHKSIVIGSADGAESCVIDCEGAEHDSHQAFWIVGGSTQIRGMTIVHGYAREYGSPGLHLLNGGAIFCDSGSTTDILSCVFRSNHANYGGALAGRNSKATVSDSRFYENGSGYGGALYWIHGNLSVEDCLIQGNSASGGGAIEFDGDSLLVRRCVIDSNLADSHAGSISSNGGALAVIEDCTISRTTGEFPNVDIVMPSIVRNTRIHGGRASSWFYEPNESVIRLGDNALVEGCVISNNSIVYPDGALGCILKIGRNGRIANSTVSSNRLVTRVIDCDTGVTIENCIIANNADGKAVAASIINVFCTDIHGNDGGDWIGPLAGQLGINGNISADPLFCDTLNGVYSLNMLSPCAPRLSPCGELMGAFGVGCGYAGPVWYVSITGNDSTGDGSASNPFATIRRSINVVADGDTVLLADGTYTGAGNRDISITHKDVVIMSAAGADFCTIDCQGADDAEHRAFWLIGGNVQIRGLTVVNGYAWDYQSPAYHLLFGGAFLCDSGTVANVDSCHFRSNQGRFGGAIAGVNSTILISDCTFDSNMAGHGGAIYCSSASAHILDCQFNHSMAEYGGGIYFNGDTLSITRGTFTVSWAGSWGGAMIAGEYGAAYVLVDRCVIQDTRGFGSNIHIFARCELLATDITGGHTLNYSQSLVDSLSHFGGSSLLSRYLADRKRFNDRLGNTSTSSDDHPLLVLGDSALVSDCLIHGNTGTDWLGTTSAVLSVGGASRIELTTFADNQLTTSVVEFTGTSGVVDRCIIARNLNAFSLGGLDAEAMCSNVFGNGGGDWVGPIAGQLGINGNINGDPLFCDTATGNYSLQYGSPCRYESTGCGQMGALSVSCDGGALNAHWIVDELPDHVISDSPAFSWSRLTASPQTQFNIEVGSDSDWAVAEMWQPGAIVSTDSFDTYGGKPLNDGSTYHSRARIGDEAFWSDWIETSFRINSVPSLPSQISPMEYMEVATALPTMVGVVTADPEADPQQLQFAIFMDDSLLVEQSPLVPAAPVPAGDTVSWMGTVPLLENGSYIWAVRAFDGYEYTSYWSAWRVFFVNAIQEAPSISGLLTPRGDSMVYSQHPDFAWNPSADPDPFDSIQYDHRVAIDSLFAFAQETDSLTDTSQAQAVALETGRRYWWKVLSRDNHGLTSTSAVETFRTYRPGDVNGSSTLTSSDIVTLVNYVFKGQALTVPECAGNVNEDAVVNSSDIIYLVNTVFKGGAEPKAGCA